MSTPQVGNNYAWTVEFIEKPIGSVVEVGSRDGMDAVYFARTYNCPVIAFECDPVQFPITEQNLKDAKLPDARSFPYALLDKDGIVDFRQVDQELYPSAGVSSLLEINFENRQLEDVDRGRASVQIPVEVQGHRFDTLDIAAPDVLALDVQGVEIQVLKGFGQLLKNVKYVVTEAERVPSYSGGNSFRGLNSYMQLQGFRIVASTAGGSSQIMRWRQAFSQNVRIAINDRTLRPWRKYQGCFDVLYLNERFKK